MGEEEQMYYPADVGGGYDAIICPTTISVAKRLSAADRSGMGIRLSGGLDDSLVLGSNDEAHLQRVRVVCGLMPREEQFRPVRSLLRPNPTLGFFDMSGNVAEWCHSIST